jgi:1-acyl-sn-glycerol-3-phosphate acyltransferase
LLLSIPFNPWTDPKRLVMDWLAQLWGRGIFWALPRVTIEATGFQHLQSGPVMVCPNHNTVADTAMMLAVIPPVKWVVKTPVFFVPGIGLHLWLAGYIRAGTGKEGDSARVIATCLKWFKRGCHVLWFPEGTRSPDGKMLRFRTGPFHAAKQAGVKIVPVAISGMREVLPPRSLRYVFTGRIQITFLPGFEVDDPKAAANKAKEMIATQIAIQTAPVEELKSAALMPEGPRARS